MTTHQVMEVIDRGGLGLVLLVDGQGKLVTTLTDGDIRRAILDGVETEDSVAEVKQSKIKQGRLKPLTLLHDAEKSAQIELMRERQVRYLPLVDSENVPMELSILDKLVPVEKRKIQAVVMAGGEGTRLHPLTLDTPKPMLPVKGKPILEWIVEGLKNAGIHQLNISTNYKAGQIVDHFKQGEGFGVNIGYLEEDAPLGTAGALSLMETPAEPFIVMNGDIFTDMDFESLVHFHHDHKADITVCVRKYHFTVPYGVIRSEKSLLTALEEKPRMDFFVNAGIYLVEPKMLSYIPKRVHFDMTDLLQVALDEGLTVATFPVIEEWVDIGKHEDYRKVNES
ncbi:MAG: nucleotidyltransferase family protein [Verrucomicrobiota bacterium]